MEGGGGGIQQEMEDQGEAETPGYKEVLLEAALALRGSDAEASTRWSTLSNAELSAEVGRYRQLLAHLAARLAALGEEVPLELLPAPPAAAAVPPDGSQDTPGDGPPANSSPSGAGGDDAAELAAALAEMDPSEWQVPPHCVPIHANVTTYDWGPLVASAQFDVVLMDPPWQLATANPTRGVALGYSQLSDADIAALPVPQLQAAGGLLFVWVINAKYKATLDLFARWGYRLVDEVVWVKMTVNRRLAKSHGYYLQHAKELCLVGQHGTGPPSGMAHGVGTDVILSERRGQSQKPEELYGLIEELVPRGRYLEIFARKNNLRNFWVSIGNEVTGTGLPEQDLQAMQQSGTARAPGAVYGRRGPC